MSLNGCSDCTIFMELSILNPGLYAQVGSKLPILTMRDKERGVYEKEKRKRKRKRKSAIVISITMNAKTLLFWPRIIAPPSYQVFHQKSPLAHRIQSATACAKS
jgi:hypothetical protein